MGYDIPDKVRYREKIIFGLDMKQLAYALVFGVGALLAYGLPINGGAKFIAPSGIIILGIGFTFLKLESRVMEQFSYFKATRLKKDMDSFASKVIQIKKIKNDLFLLSNKELRAVLQVTPLNYALFDDDRKKSLIANYRDFLNHLNYPVQIVVRTKRASLQEYYQAYEGSAKGITEGGLGELYEDFKEHVTEFLESNKVNEREYYLIVCLRLESKKQEEGISRLEERVLIVQEKLLDCGIESRRLGKDEILPFAVSYFNEVEHEEKTKKAKRKKAKARPKKARKRKKAAKRKKAKK